METKKRFNPHISAKYGARELSEDHEIPKERIPQKSSPQDLAYRIIHDELNLDGNPALNVASFVTTWMDEKADHLVQNTINKNFIDFDEYPQTEVIHRRIVAMLGNLFNANVPEGYADEIAKSHTSFVGTATIGSSEAIMLGLLAHKWNWKSKRKSHPKDKPYVIFGTDVHTCWEKFSKYFDVETLLIYMEEGKYYCNADDVKSIIEQKIVDNKDIMEHCGYTVEEAGDRKVGELVIAVGCVVGTTFTGDMDDVKGINDMLNDLNWDIPIHVDGASGGFVLPFSSPEVEWDFRLNHVESINVSNHKFGLVYPGLGSVLFRDENVVPQELFFDIDYLGGSMHNYSLNFSRASNSVLLQYYNFLKLGHEGYKKIMDNCLANSSYLASEIQKDFGDMFEIVSKSDTFPVVSFQYKKDHPDDIKFTLNELSHDLQAKGWIVPAYPMPEHAHHITVMRFVVRENINRDLVDIFLDNLAQSIKYLKELTKERPTKSEHKIDVRNDIGHRKQNKC